MKRIIFPMVLAGLVAGVWAQEVTYGPFGPRGEGGSKNGQTMRIGTGGSVFELDAFVSAAGLDLNGGAAGVAAQLSRDVLPAGLSYAVVPQLTPDRDLVLTYVFTNATGGTFTNVHFFFLLDAEIDQEVNTFFNEHGAREGSLGLGASDVFVDQFQIDEPGFVAGTLFNNLYAGALSDSNAIPAGVANDVALAIGFAVGDLAPGNALGLAVEVSGRGHALGPLKLVQRDSAAGSTNTVTLSGLVATLAGTIFLDGNTNGSPDSGEGLPNVTLQLREGTNVVAQVATDGSGNYSFNTPPAGVYELAVDGATLPPGLVNTVDPDGTPDQVTTVTLVPGQLNLKNWGYRTQILRGLVFRDTNNNGGPDAGEGLAGVKLTLQGTNGVAVAEATTEVGGSYNFSRPPTGSFTLRVDPGTLPAGLVNSVDPDGTADNATAVVLAPGGTTILNWGYRVPVVSGLANVTALAGLNFQWRLYQPQGWLIGRLTITNLSSGASFAAPFQLGLPTSTNYWLARPGGTLSSGAPYVDLSAAVNAALAPRGALEPGGTVTVDGVEVYSRDRSAPPRSLFELWAAQQ